MSSSISVSTRPTELGVDHEPSTTIDRLKIEVAKHAAGRHFQACQDLFERLFSRRRTGVATDLLARGDFKIEMFEDRQDSGVDDREVFAGHANAVNGWIRLAGRTGWRRLGSSKARTEHQSRSNHLRSDNGVWKEKLSGIG